LGARRDTGPNFFLSAGNGIITPKQGFRPVAHAPIRRSYEAGVHSLDCRAHPAERRQRIEVILPGKKNALLASCRHQAIPVFFIQSVTAINKKTQGERRARTMNDTRAPPSRGARQALWFITATHVTDESVVFAIMCRHYDGFAFLFSPPLPFGHPVGPQPRTARAWPVTIYTFGSTRPTSD